jgi:Tol biopolymer transport system component
MRFGSRHRLAAIALALAGAIVLLSVPGPQASGKKVGRITRIKHGTVFVGSDSYEDGDTPDLDATDVIKTSGRAMMQFTLSVGGEGATCDLNRAPVTLAVVPKASVLFQLMSGRASCSTTPKGRRKVFKFGKDVTVTTQDPVFAASVLPGGTTLKLQRGVAVVTGRGGPKKAVVVALNKQGSRVARTVFVPRSGNPRQPTISQLSAPERSALSQLASKLPPVTDFKPPPTTLRQRPQDPTTEHNAFFSFGGGELSACSLDRGPFLACTSPHTQVYPSLPAGRHTFSVRSIDAAGNTGPTVSFSWTIQRSPSGPIVFESNRRDPTEYEIYTVAPDATGLKQLTSPPGQSFDPAWSPDGTQIVFESNRSTFGRSQLFVMSADGTNQHRLVTSDGRDRFPKWSPDGTEIVFERGIGKQTDIWVVDSDGGNPRQLTHDAGLNADPVWSPDGSQIAFDSTRDGNAEIYVMNADGSDQHAIAHDPAADINPAWSPDGKEIAFESNRDGKARAYVMGADGSNPERLTSVDEFEFHPAWSPDGSRLVFATGQGTDTQLEIFGRDGSLLQVLTHSPNQNLVPSW